MEEVGRIVVLQVPDRYPDIRDLMTNKGIRRHAFVLFFVWYVLHVLNDIIILFMYAVRSLGFALGKEKLDRTLYFDKWARPGWFCRSMVDFTGQSLSEALLFSEHVENMLCTKNVLNVRNNFCTQHVLPRFELGIFMYWTCNSMNNLSSCCGLVDPKIRASD